MKCLNCNTEMKCYNDVVTCSDRIDFVRCPECNAEADIIYNVYTNKITKVDWREGDK